MLSPISYTPTSPSPILKNENGYVDNRYDGKPEQMLNVCSYIVEKGFLPKELVENEVAWFYGQV